MKPVSGNMKPLVRERASRTNGEQRRKQILESAIYLAGKIGHLKITRNAVANECRISGALIYKYFTDIESLKNRVLKEAVKMEILPILAHCVSTTKLPQKLKQKTIEYLSK